MAVHGVVLALSLGWLYLDVGAQAVGKTPGGSGAERAVAGTAEGGLPIPAYGILRRELEFRDRTLFASLSRALPGRELTDRETLPVPFNAPPGSLVRLQVTRGYRRMALADGRHLAVRRGISPEEYTTIAVDDARDRFSEALEGVNVLSVIDPDREGAYVVTLLPGGRLLDYSQNSAIRLPR